MAVLRYPFLFVELQSNLVTFEITGSTGVIACILDTLYLCT